MCGRTCLDLGYPSRTSMPSAQPSAAAKRSCSAAVSGVHISPVHVLATITRSTRPTPRARRAERAHNRRSSSRGTARSCRLRAGTPSLAGPGTTADAADVIVLQEASSKRAAHQACHRRCLPRRRSPASLQRLASARPVVPRTSRRAERRAGQGQGSASWRAMSPKSMYTRSQTNWSSSKSNTAARRVAKDLPVLRIPAQSAAWVPVRVTSTSTWSSP